MPQPALDIALLRSFMEVSRAGSIRAAADRVGRTQSAVSLQMKRLEEVVGEPLFHRTGSGVVPTLAGERLMAGAERILAAHDDALAGFRHKGLRGAISFGCPEDYLSAFFPPLLRRFGQENPAVEIEIICATTVELRPMLQRRRIDLALVSNPASEAEAEVLRREPLVWIGGAAREPLPQDGVVPLALSAAETLDHQLARAAMESSGRPFPHHPCQQRLAGLLAIARSGLAVSVVTRAAVPPDLEIVEQGLPPLPEIGMALAYASVCPTPLVRAFGDFIAGALGGAAPPDLDGDR